MWALACALEFANQTMLSQKYGTEGDDGEAGVVICESWSQSRRSGCMSADVGSMPYGLEVVGGGVAGRCRLTGRECVNFWE